MGAAMACARLLRVPREHIVDVRGIAVRRALGQFWYHRCADCLMADEARDARRGPGGARTRLLRR
jgi:hypothetical protein